MEHNMQNTEHTDTAKDTATAYGLDDFYEDHSAFAVLVHEKLKRDSLFRRFRLDAGNSDAICRYYDRKFKAESAMKRLVNSAYDEASAIFTPGSGSCLADAAAAQYAAFIDERLMPILDKLADCAEEQVGKCRTLIEDAERALRESFHRELRGDAIYYKMYDRSYFLGKPEVEDLMSDAEISDNPLINGIYRMLQRENDYAITGLTETINELEDDVNSRADSFFSAAHDLYRGYCAKIEKIAEEIGKDLSDDDLERMRLIPKRA